MNRGLVGVFFGVFVGLALALGGCVRDSDPDSDSDSDPGLVAGEACRSANATCMDERDLLACVEGVWTSESCAASCAALGPGVSSAQGCDEALGVAPPASLCGCVPPPEGCSPGQGRCDDEDVLGWCTETWTWASVSCTELCAGQPAGESAGESALSLGCDAIGDKATCLCTNVGTPCEGDTVLCADDSALSTCEGGLWTRVECSELCGVAATCDPGAPGGAACACD